MPNGDAVDFHLCAKGEPVGAECASGGKVFVEPGFVDVVEGCPPGDIRQHDRALDEIVHGIAVRLDNDRVGCGAVGTARLLA